MAKRSPLLQSPLALLAAAGAADRRPRYRRFIVEKKLIDAHYSEPIFHDIRGHLDLVRPGPRSLVGHLVTHTNYFSGANAAQLLDYDHDNDPIWCCIVTEEEASCLLDVFWKHLQPLVRFRRSYMPY